MAASVKSGSTSHVPARQTSSPAVRFSELTPSRKALVRLCQSLNFGQIQNLPVCGGDPTFGPTTVVLVETKLDTSEVPREERNLDDFTLCDEVSRMLTRL